MATSIVPASVQGPLLVCEEGLSVWGGVNPATGEIAANGVKDRLEAAGVRIIPDLCWCSISEPVFPPQAKVLMTNSGKYAHYAPGQSNRTVRFGSLAQCAESARTGLAPVTPPAWIATAQT